MAAQAPSQVAEAAVADVGAAAPAPRQMADAARVVAAVFPAVAAAADAFR